MFSVVRRSDCSFTKKTELAFSIMQLMLAQLAYELKICCNVSIKQVFNMNGDIMVYHLKLLTHQH